MTFDFTTLDLTSFFCHLPLSGVVSMSLPSLRNASAVSVFWHLRLSARNISPLDRTNYNICAINRAI